MKGREEEHNSSVATTSGTSEHIDRDVLECLCKYNSIIYPILPLCQTSAPVPTYDLKVTEFATRQCRFWLFRLVRPKGIP